MTLDWIVLPVVVAVACAASGGCAETPSSTRSTPEVALNIPRMPPPPPEVAPIPEPASEQDPVAAKAALESGRDAFAIGNYAKARDDLKTSVRLDATDGAELYLAMTEEKLGNTGEAATHYKLAYELATRSGNPRAGYAKRRHDDLVKIVNGAAK